MAKKLKNGFWKINGLMYMIHGSKVFDLHSGELIHMHRDIFHRFHKGRCSSFEYCKTITGEKYLKNFKIIENRLGIKLNLYKI